MSDKFESRLNKINASVQPKGRVSGGGSGSWKNGEGAFGVEPRMDEQRSVLEPKVKPSLLARLMGFFRP